MVNGDKPGRKMPVPIELRELGSRYRKMEAISEEKRLARCIVVGRIISCVAMIME